MVAAIGDCQTPEGYRRSILFAKRLQRLEREAIERAADEAAAEHELEDEAEAVRQEFIRQHTSGEHRNEVIEIDGNNKDELLRFLPPEADAVNNDMTMEHVDVDDINVIELGNPSAPSSSSRQADVHPRARRRFTYREERIDPNQGNQQAGG